MFGADEAWVRRRQQTVLDEEGQTFADLHAHMAQMHSLTTNALLEQLTEGTAGGTSLVGLGDRIITLLGARAPEKLTATCVWLQRVLQRRQPTTMSLQTRIPRWLAAPARNAGWRLLSPSVELPAEPAPWPLRWPLHAAALVVMVGVTVAGLWLHISGLTVAGAILAGMTAVMLGQVVALIQARRWLAGKIRRGR